MIEPERFESAMPVHVRKAIAAARKKSGPIAKWYRVLDQRPWGESFVLLRTPSLPADVVGWLTGMAMFADDLGAITDVAESEGHSAPVAAMLDACAAGLRAGVSLAKHQWKRIEVLVKMQGHVPDALREELPRALVSESAVDRGVGLRLVQRCDGRKVVERARDGSDGKVRKRLDAALAALGGTAKADASEPLRATSKAELEVLWLARAAKRNPDDLDALLGTPWPAAWKAALSRVSALGKFSPDARIAAILPRIRAQHTSFGSGPLRRCVDAVLPKHEVAAPVAKPKQVNVDALWQALRERPRDLEVRAVLADALQAAGDPRGEYIALALAIAAGTADAAAKKRAAQLLSAHIDTWSAGIPGALRSSRQFERGFLTSVACKTDVAGLRDSLADPVWWTVEDVLIQCDQRRDRDGLDEVIVKLLETAPALDTFIERWWGFDGMAKVTGSFPRVRSLGISSGIDQVQLAAFPSLALFGTYGHVRHALEHMGGVPVLLVFDHRPLADSLAAYDKTPSVPELRLTQGRELDMEHHGWLVRVRKGERRAMLSWGVGKYEAGWLASSVEALVASGRREIAVAPPTVGRPVFDADAAKIKNAKLELVAEPLRTWRA